jgi:hypothetical protein
VQQTRASRERQIALGYSRAVAAADIRGLMSDQPVKEWVLPASIPFAELKGHDLEECIYWLFDAMGAKDLEWRTGGKGGGAADGGRDLEARFYTPGADSEIEPQSWWIECKGRSGTVEPDAVKEAAINAQARAELDYLVVATNTQFSNPTRDWIKEWQLKHPRPKIKLWDSSHLERLLSRQPTVVLRLFASALSLQGQFQAMESQFWIKMHYVTEGILKGIWENRTEIDFTGLGVFALIANEFAHGDINKRPWAASLDFDVVLQSLMLSLTNLPYMQSRLHSTGASHLPIVRSYAYLIIHLLQIIDPSDMTNLIHKSVFNGDRNIIPDHFKEMLVAPVLDQLLSEMQDVCSSDCSRIYSLSPLYLTKYKDEIKEYWLKFEPSIVEKKEENNLILEKNDGLCKVGYDLNENGNCSPV